MRGRMFRGVDSLSQSLEVTMILATEVSEEREVGGDCWLYRKGGIVSYYEAGDVSGPCHLILSNGEPWKDVESWGPGSN